MRICVLGGSGFVGKYLVERLTGEGHEVVVPTRDTIAHRDLLVLTGVRLVTADLHSPAALRRQFSGMDAVVNLIGILNERRSGDFARVHVDIPRRVVEACEAAEVPRLLHVSALNAGMDAPSRYLRSKWQGEVAVKGARFAATVFRPSVLFGRGDSFSTRLASWIRFAPGVFPLAAAESRFAPLHVADLVRAMVAALRARKTFGATYDLCGPVTYTLRQWVEYIARLQERHVRVVALGDRLSWFQAWLLERMPGQLLTRDNYLTLRVDAVCTTPWPPVFAPLPEPPAHILPSYLARSHGRVVELDR
ncbi:MAG: complex I NDUFA9 subunit family protein [Acidiferrobacteraceae bacterium]